MSIWQRHRELERERQLKMQELMEEYDREVYYPKLKLLRQECYQTHGHRGGKYHSNGFGWTWLWCNQCGGQYQIQGPRGETKPDSGSL